MNLKALARAILEREAITHNAARDAVATPAAGWKPLPRPGHPAYSILETCQRAGVALRIDPENGDLVVGKAGAKSDEPTQPWVSLVHELEAHVEAVAGLVESGWTLTAEFPALS
ncbi:MAG: hypothetical protein ACLPTZ_01820 [Beijerinckiaceae bacterium]